MNKPKPDDDMTFDEAEQKRRDGLLLKLLKTPPEHRPKRERAPKDKADERDRS